MPLYMLMLLSVFGRSDLAALSGCHFLNVCLFVSENAQRLLWPVSMDVV